MDSKLQTASKHYELLIAFGSIDDVSIPCYKIKNARDRLDLYLGIIHRTKLGPIVAHADLIHIHKNEETKEKEYARLIFICDSFQSRAQQRYKKRSSSEYVLYPQDEAQYDLQKALISGPTDISWYWSSQEKYLQSTKPC